MKSNINILILILALSFCCVKAWAGWTGPQEILTGSWGSSPSQFYFSSGDTEDSFPRDIGIDGHGRIFVNDEYNARIKVFDSRGSLLKIIGAPEGVNTKLGWPYNIYIHPNGSIVAGYDGPKKFFFDDSARLIKKVDVYGDAFQTSQGFIFYVQDNKYDLYSPTGQLIKTYTERPLELGKVSETKRKSGEYRVKVTYPDKEWRISSEACPGYSRDTKGNLYCVGDTGIVRYNDCGKEVASLFMPESNIEEISRSSGLGSAESIIKEDVEYGSPVLGPNGDVYTWKRTPDTYSILKWIWVDSPDDPKGGPDAPADLKVAPSTDGLCLAWTASPQDPGCVEGYEVERSSTAAGIFSNITTTSAGVVKYNDTGAFAGSTYDYRIRAKSSCGASPYTTVVSGKRL